MDDLVFDIDGNGAFDAFTDSILIARFAFGFTGSTLIANAVANDATRTTATEIENYLNLVTSLAIVNNSDDTIVGTPGDDTLEGFGGSDTLTGGFGNDLFVFNNRNEGIDTITDFGSGTFGGNNDAIAINVDFGTSRPVITDVSGTTGNPFFYGLNSTAIYYFTSFQAGAGVSPGNTTPYGPIAGNFGLNPLQVTGEFFLYNRNTGDLWYDADGGGPIDAIQLATLPGGPPLSIPQGSIPPAPSINNSDIIFVA
jgi:Ca2+-binding RTX toxin-like protein